MVDLTFMVGHQKIGHGSFTITFQQFNKKPPLGGFLYVGRCDEVELRLLGLLHKSLHEQGGIIPNNLTSNP